MKAEVGVLRLLQQSAHPNIANMVELLEPLTPTLTLTLTLT